MPQEPLLTGTATEYESIVAVFDSKIMALRAVLELQAAEFEDIWLGVVRGETDAGETAVISDDGDERPLHRVLAERGAHEAQALRFEGILPPCTAVMSLRVSAKGDHAIRIIELTGGHIEYV